MKSMGLAGVGVVVFLAMTGSATAKAPSWCNSPRADEDQITGVINVRGVINFARHPNEDCELVQGVVSLFYEQGADYKPDQLTLGVADGYEFRIAVGKVQTTQDKPDDMTCKSQRITLSTGGKLDAEFHGQRETIFWYDGQCTTGDFG